MPKKRPTRRAPSLLKPAQTTAPGVWENRILPFLERRSLALALCLIAIAAVRVVATYSELSITFDEPGHFGCGLQYVAQHIYQYESQHPPLARAATALGPYLAGARPAGERDRNEEGRAVLSHDPDRLVPLMRLGILPFFLLGSLVVYCWARHHLGNAVAVIATGLFAMIPPVLADAGLATTDMALAACLGASFFSLVLWAESPTWKRSLLMGVTAALAALSKFTALAFLPAAAILALLFHLAVQWPGWRKLATLFIKRAVMFVPAVLTGALLVWAAYWFSFGRVPQWNVSLPAPEFFDGILDAMAHNQHGHAAYLLGKNSLTGWWYYFPVVLAVKTPIGFLLMLAVGAGLCRKNRAKSAFLPLAFCLGVLLPSMVGRVDIGLRHILPIYIGFSILAALAVVQMAEWARIRPWTLKLAGLCVAWMAVSGAIRHPNYLAYFNEFVLSEPDRVLVDANLDWGQDLKLLARRLRELGVHEVSANCIRDYQQAWYGLPSIKPIDPDHPAPGWNIVSPTIARTSQPRGWFFQTEPTERVGGLLLYNLPPGFRVPSQDYEDQIFKTLHR